MALDLRRLRVFREVAARGSFSGAALALDYTQSSVSQAIATLEAEVGLTLLDRSSRPVRVTEAGEVLLRHAEVLLGQAAAAEEELAAFAGAETGTLRLAGFFTALATFIPPAIASFSRARPRVALDLRQAEPEVALRLLRAGDADLAVVYRFADRPEPDADRFRWVRLFDDPYVLVVPRGHRFARLESVALDECASEAWVGPEGDTPFARVLRDLCVAHGFEPDVVYETADIVLAQPLVATGRAVSLMPALGLAPRRRDVVAVPIRDVPVARGVWVASLAARRLPLAVPMVDALRSAAAETASELGLRAV